MRNAGWHALNMRAGGRRERNGKVVALEDISTYFQGTLRIDPTDYAAEYNNKIDFDLMADQLAAEGYEDKGRILDLMQQRESWNDIAAELGEKPDAVRKRIRRWLSKGLTWPRGFFWP